MVTGSGRLPSGRAIRPCPLHPRRPDQLALPRRRPDPAPHRRHRAHADPRREQYQAASDQ